MEYIKPNVLISACINHSACRHDAAIINEPFLKLLEPYVNFKRVCPEVGIGLGIPRETIRLVKDKNYDMIRLIENKTGRDLTEEMNQFSTSYLANLSGIHGFIFKTRSPSCGVEDTRVYSSQGKSGAIGKESGLFSKIVLDEFVNYPVIDDGRIRDYHLREHFLSRIFLLAEFDEIAKNRSLKELQAFQHNHKMLLLSFTQQGQKKLGQIVADAKKDDLSSSFKQYRKTLIEVTNHMPSVGTKVNVFLHTFGQLSHLFSENEKQFILKSVDQYSHSQIPFSTLSYLLKSYAIQYDNSKVLNQSFFHPFPEALVQVRDSGKSII